MRRIFNNVQFLSASMVVALATLSAANTVAQTTMDRSKMGATKADQAKDITDGLVRKVNKETGKVTIQHGEMHHLGMPAMTMAFPVKTAGLLDNVQAGDKIKFKVVKENGRLVITELRPAK